MEREKSLQIRFHHLDLWADIFKAYADPNFGVEVKPWELGVDPESKAKLEFFAGKFIRNNIYNAVTVKDSLEDSSLTYAMENSLRYLYDVIGTDQKTHDKVKDARTAAVIKILTSALEDRKAKVFLTLDSDDFCRSCAVGNHCERTRLQKLEKDDKDYVFRKAVKNLINSGNLGDSAGSERGRIFLTAELLFDPVFYQKLQSEVNKIDPSIYANIS